MVFLGNVLTSKLKQRLTNQKSAKISQIREKLSRGIKIWDPSPKIPYGILNVLGCVMLNV